MDPIPVFEMGRSGASYLDVRLPAAWARVHERVRVKLVKAQIPGWHAAIEAPGRSEPLIEFTWTDRVEQGLRGELQYETPIGADGYWEDLDQGRWALVMVRPDGVFIAETDFDALLDTPDDATLELVEPGHVDFGAVRIWWNCVPRAAWGEAWDAARAFAGVS